MARTIPAFPAAANETDAAEQHPGKTSKSWDIDVITPLFGGGVEAGVNDPLTPVRPSSVRGHLRFWWRATRGALEADVAALHKREGQVWGTATEPSPVEVEIEVKHGGTRAAYHDLTAHPERTDPPPQAYALFPFKRDGNRPERSGLTGVSFRLTLRYPADQEPDIECAVWAWVNLGGIGARTRRGCGALFCELLAPKAGEKIADWYAHRRKQYGSPIKTRSWKWPVLWTQPWVQQAAGEPKAAWAAAVKLIRDFRQGRDFARNGSRGRSRWPEADSIRGLTGLGDPMHAASITIPDPRNQPAFPRADLGLPIILHLKDEDLDGELYPGEGGTRMASPIIVKPLGVGDARNAVPMVLMLHTEAARSVTVECYTGGPERKKVFSDTFKGATCGKHLAAYPQGMVRSPMVGLSTRGFVREAFSKFAADKGFK